MSEAKTLAELFSSYLDASTEPSEELEAAILEAAAADSEQLLGLAQDEIENSSDLVSDGNAQEAARRMLLVRRLLMVDESAPYHIADCEAVFLAASAPEVYVDIFPAMEGDSEKEDVLRAVQVLMALEQPLHLVASSLETASLRLLDEGAPKVALSAATRLVEIGGKARSDFWQSVGHSCVSRIYMDAGNVKKAIPHGEKFLLYAKKAELSPLDIATASASVASWLVSTGEAKRALGFALDAEKLMKGDKALPEVQVLVYAVLGDVYEKLRRPELAEEYRKKEAEAESLVSPLGDSPGD